MIYQPTNNFNVVVGVCKIYLVLLLFCHAILQLCNALDTCLHELLEQPTPKQLLQMRAVINTVALYIYYTKTLINRPGGSYFNYESLTNQSLVSESIDLPTYQRFQCSSWSLQDIPGTVFVLSRNPATLQCVGHVSPQAT